MWLIHRKDEHHDAPPEGYTVVVLEPLSWWFAVYPPGVEPTVMDHNAISSDPGRCYDLWDCTSSREKAIRGAIALAWAHKQGIAYHKAYQIMRKAMK